MNRRPMLLLVILIGACSRDDAIRPVVAPPIPDPPLQEAEQPVRQKIAAARASLVLTPESAGAWGRLGIVLDAHGLYVDALVCYRHAAALNSDDARWPQLAGMALAVDDPAAAIAFFERAVELRTDSATLRQVFGDTLVRAGQGQAAQAQYEAALALDADARRALLGLAELALRNDAPDEALRLLLDALEIDFCDREVHARLARTYRRLGNYLAAEREALLVKAYPDLAPFADPVRGMVTKEAVSARAQNDRGLRALKAGRLEDAQRAFREAVRLRPDSVRHKLNLGGTLVRQGHAEEAMPWFEEALDMAPDDPDVHSNTAVALLELGRLDEAQFFLERALASDPEHDGAYFNMGLLRQHRREISQAVKAWNKALKINPANVPAHLSLARYRAAGQQMVRAVEHWRHAAEYGCAPPEAMYKLAMAMAGRGRFADAVSLLDRGLGRSPDDTAMLATLVTILATCPDADQRDGRRAVELAERLLRRTSPDHVPALNLLAASQAETGDFDAAIETSRHALTLARDGVDARAAKLIASRIELYEQGRPYHQLSAP